ncbi:unnamed protein product [Linum tenue]|uniref:Uncharacterized protein n=1 Tax=Linum tenue TaxID=586396 RepID=A0AAV0RDT2_9ROSI|nr:unnamed protein product [Linum tenue]
MRRWRRHRWRRCRWRLHCGGGGTNGTGVPWQSSGRLAVRNPPMDLLIPRFGRARIELGECHGSQLPRRRPVASGPTEDLDPLARLYPDPDDQGNSSLLLQRTDLVLVLVHVLARRGVLVGP